MNPYVRNGDVGDGDWSRERHWACPFYLSNPIRHANCKTFKLGRVPDVRQHIERKHAEDAGKEEIEKMKRKNDRGTTNVERWYALWALFFPGQVPPATPYYTGTEFADLSIAFVSSFIKEWEKVGEPGDVKTAFAGYVAFVKTTSLEMKFGRMSIQPVADIPQGTGTQDSNTQGSNPYQGPPLLPDPPSPMTMGQPQQPDPRSFFPGYYDTPAPNFPTQAQVPSMTVADSQYWPCLVNPAVFSTVPDELPPVPLLYTAAANGLFDYTVDSSNFSGAVNWASATGFGRDGDGGQVRFMFEDSD